MGLALLLSSVLSQVFPEIGVVDVQIEDDAELSSHRNSELGLEDERVACPIRGGLAEILVVTLFFLTLTSADGMEFELAKESTNFFGGGCGVLLLSEPSA